MTGTKQESSTHFGAGVSGEGSGDDVVSGGDKTQLLRPPGGDKKTLDCARTLGGAVMLDGAERVVPAPWCHCNPPAHSSCTPSHARSSLQARFLRSRT
jgi:hypothetical protein